MIVGHPFTLKFEAARRWIAQLQEWEIDGFGTYQSPQHYVFAIQRFHTWAYWRPMTIARYERLTQDYEGPHLPILFLERSIYVMKLWFIQGLIFLCAVIIATAIGIGMG